MKRKVVIPRTISGRIRSFGLSRQVLIALLDGIHEGLPNEADQFQHLRVDDQRSFRFPLIIATEGRSHRFDLTVDDTTSPEHFLVDSISYVQE